MTKRTPEDLLELAKSIKKGLVSDIAKAKLNNLSEGYSTWESILWTTLKAEAEEYINTGTIGEYMTEEIGVKYTADTLATTILTKSEQLKQGRASIILWRQVKEDEIDALTDIESVNSYKPTL